MQQAFLFDFDGVIADTEGEYTIFWDEVGRKYKGMNGFGSLIKGCTMASILNKYFPTDDNARAGILKGMTEVESKMSYRFVPGVIEFVKKVREKGYKTAIITSSSKSKMEFVKVKHPEITALFDVILKDEDFAASKPDPDCYLKGMKLLHSDPSHSVVFEDSVNGLLAARKSGAYVVGLVTTNSLETVKEYSDYQIYDFTDADAILSHIETAINISTKSF